MAWSSCHYGGHADREGGRLRAGAGLSHLRASSGRRECALGCEEARAHPSPCSGGLC